MLGRSVDGAEFGGGFCAHIRECMSLTNVMQPGCQITCVTTIADRLKQAREELGLSQEDLARRAGVSNGTIGNVESGLRKDPRSLLEIAAAAQVMPAWLKHGKPPKRLPSWKPDQPAPEGVNVRPVAQDLSHPQPEDDPTTCTWEFILSGTELPQRFSVAAPDDALAPVTPRGTGYLFAAGADPPADGTVVIVQAGNGRRYMRLFFAGAGDEWEARARDPVHRALHSTRDELTLLASATHRAGGQG